MFQPSLSLLLTVVMIVVLNTGASAATITIGPGTTPQPGDVATADYGEWNGQGQTFTVPLGFPTLESVSISYILSFDLSVPVADKTLTFELFEWTGTTVGALLASQALPPLVGNDGSTPVFSGPQLLTEGATYLAFISGVGSEPGLFKRPDELYADGSWAVRLRASGTFETQIGGEDYDARFAAEFSDVGATAPEPVTSSLLLVGAIALARRHSRRRVRPVRAPHATKANADFTECSD